MYYNLALTKFQDILKKGAVPFFVYSVKRKAEKLEARGSKFEAQSSKLVVIFQPTEISIVSLNFVKR